MNSKGLVGWHLDVTLEQTSSPVLSVTQAFLITHTEESKAGGGFCSALHSCLQLLGHAIDLAQVTHGTLPEE